MTIRNTDEDSGSRLPPSSPWLAPDEIEGEDGTIGNREGFELLRHSIEQLLATGSGSFRIDGGQISLHQLKICEPPASRVSAPFPEVMLAYTLGFLFVIFIPLLALFGLYRLIQILFF